MDYEKKYKEALERARTKLTNEVAADIFPELTESEDERIRKWLICTLKSLNCSPVQIDGAYKMMLPAIDWLEKQGEQKPAAWSEEDEEIRNFVTNIFKDSQRNGVSEPIMPEQFNKIFAWLNSIKERYTWKPSDLPHWKKSTLPNDNTTGFNSDYFCYKGYSINYKELFEKLPKDD